MVETSHTIHIVTNLHSCASYVGVSGWKQRVSLGGLCWLHGTVAHEIGEIF